MQREVVYKDKNLLLEYVSDGNYLHETWWGLTPSSVFLKLLDVIISALEDKQADGLILDAREHKGLMPKDQEAAATRHAEYAKKHGILKQAIIIPEDLYSKFSVTNYSEQFDKTVNNYFRYFKDIPEAEKWLREKEI